MASPFSNMATRIAGDVLHYRNYRWPGAFRSFPDDPEMRMVDKFFPYAECGALFVDEPMTERGKRRCEEKRAAMRDEGNLYLVIPPDMREEDAVSQLRAQLPRGQACG